MAVIFNQAISLPAGTTLSTALRVSDAVLTLRATFLHWTGQRTLQIGVQISFDDGATWRDIGAVGPTVSPSGTYKGRQDLWIQVDNLWKQCGFTYPAGSRYRAGQMCGEVYGPDQTPPETLVHSDYAFQDVSQVAYSAITFHDPNLTPRIGGPLRQVRAVLTASGAISSTLVVDAT